jgi:hypothetical protein
MNATLALISGRALLYSLLTLVVAGVIFWALWRLIALVTMQPLNQILKIIWVVLVVVFAVDFLFGVAGWVHAPVFNW